MPVLRAGAGAGLDCIFILSKYPSVPNLSSCFTSVLINHKYMSRLARTSINVAQSEKTKVAPNETFLINEMFFRVGDMLVSK